MIKPVILLLSLFFSLQMDAAIVSPTVPPAKFDVTKVKARDIERITGKKMTLFQKIRWKLAQVALRYSGQITARQERQAEMSMFLGIGSIVILLLGGVLPFLGLFCIPAAILAVIFGAKSLKGNSNTKGIVGVITGGLTLVIVVLAIIIVAALIATWGY